MKVSYNWLKEFADISLTPQELSVCLTDCGLEVEELTYWQSVKGGLEGVVIGKVLSKEKHPNADKLSLTQVDIGASAPLQIVCGAPNVDAGQIVVVATIGTILYKEEQTFEIKQARIRGIESFGMICSEDELGIGNSHDGIMVLTDSVEVGTLAKDYFEITEDWIFTIGLTPNRIDAASHIGVARDIVAALNTKNSTKITLKEKSISDFVENESNPVSIEIANTEACPRYSGITISGIKIAPSPKWLSDRVTSLGMRPINNIVDITNYVMFELGQPLHAFDMAHLTGKKIVVRTFEKETPFLCLDEVERKISTEDLMICNAEEGMCIAGVFGGLKSGVTESTTDVFIESAYFNPRYVRKTSNRHALKTESSFRFERGTNPSTTIEVLKRTVQLILDIAGGTVSSPIYDVYPKPIHKTEIKLEFDYVQKIIGFSIPTEIQKQILIDLDFEITHFDDKYAVVLASLSKVDVSRPIDVVEEILRIYGYNHIPFSDLMKTSLNVSIKPNPYKLQNIVSDMLVSNGFYELMTNSLTNASYYKNTTNDDLVHVLNPLSKELNVMRKDMLYSGIEAIVHNINRKQHNLKFFEFGKIYKKVISPKTESLNNKYAEGNRLVLFITGSDNPINWKHQTADTDFYYLKEYVNTILKKFNVETQLQSEQSSSELFTYGLSYKLKSKKSIIAELGKVSENHLALFDCKQEVFYANINWDLLIEMYAEIGANISEPPKYPEVHRDIAMLLDKDIQYQQVYDIVMANGGGIVQSVSLFDVYQGKNIPEGKKSYAINIILQHSEKTLSDKETEIIINKIKKTFEISLNATIR